MSEPSIRADGKRPPDLTMGRAVSLPSGNRELGIRLFPPGIRHFVIRSRKRSGRWRGIALGQPGSLPYL